VCLLVVLGGWLLPAPAQAQAWADAYRAEDYQRAADLLHPLVAESLVLGASHDDPEPARRLAEMYVRGLGVERDAIGACALARWSFEVAERGAPQRANPFRTYAGIVAESERFVDEVCGALPDADQVTASNSIGCFAFGMPEQVLTIGQQAVQIGRRGIGLVGADPDRLAPLQCPLAIAHIRTRTIRPPQEPAPGVSARHFIEVFFWRLFEDPTDHSRGYALLWQPFEVSDSGIGWGEIAQVTSVRGWPGLGSWVAAGLATVPAMEMIRSGHVRWRIDGDPPRRGWFMRSEAATR